jgi:hypothetical protein
MNKPSMKKPLIIIMGICALVFIISLLTLGGVAFDCLNQWKCGTI